MVLMQVKIDWEQKDENGQTILDLIDSSPAYRMVSRLFYAGYYREKLQAVKEKEKNSAKSPSPLELFRRSVRRIMIDENVQKSLFPILPVLGNEPTVVTLIYKNLTYSVHAFLSVTI